MSGRSGELLLRFGLDVYAGAFRERVKFVDGEVVELFGETTGPTDFDGIEFR